jgi:fibronectin type III domain protein
MAPVTQPSNSTIRASEPPEIAPKANAIVSVDVTNTGDREGDEVRQLYIHQRVSSVTRPVLELHGFQRLHIRPGEKSAVTFTLTPDNLALWNEAMKFVVEPGVFDVLLGTSSAKTQAIPLKVTVQ